MPKDRCGTPSRSASDGVSVVRHSDQILPVAEGLALMQQARGRRVAVIADGGGQATITSDRLSDAGLELAELSEATRKRLHAEQEANLQGVAKAQGMDEAQVDFWRRKFLGIGQ